MNGFLPTIEPLEASFDPDYKLFSQIVSAPVPHAEWDFVQQTMSGHDGDYMYLDFDRSHMFDHDSAQNRGTSMSSPDHNRQDALGISPIIRSLDIPSDEEVEMNRFVNFNH